MVEAKQNRKTTLRNGGQSPTGTGTGEVSSSERTHGKALIRLRNYSALTT